MATGKKQTTYLISNSDNEFLRDYKHTTTLLTYNTEYSLVDVVNEALTIFKNNASNLKSLSQDESANDYPRHRFVVCISDENAKMLRDFQVKLMILRGDSRISQSTIFSYVIQALRDDVKNRPGFKLLHRPESVRLAEKREKRPTASPKPQSI